MKGCARAFLLVLLAAAAVGAADPPKGPDGPKLWDLPTDVPVPAPMPGPDAVTVLDPGVLLVVTHRAPCVVRGFPAGKLRVVGRELKAGESLVLPARYYDGGKVVEEEREFRGPLWVYRARCETSGPAAGGDCELAVLPVGGAEADLLVRRVKCNLTPQPPPAPDPKPPGPNPPDPKPPVPVTSFRVIFVYETGAAQTPAAQRVMFGEKVRTYLDAATTPHPVGGKGWRRYDKDADAANERDPDLKALWAAAKPAVTAVPCVVVAVNRRADVLPLPADEDAAVALFKKYAEGK